MKGESVQGWSQEAVKNNQELSEVVQLSGE